MTTIDEFNKWLQRLEDQSLEFKKAENSYFVTDFGNIMLPYGAIL